MTKEDKTKILELRSKGYGYKSIASQLNLPIPSVTSFCRRNELSTKDNQSCCKNCGAKLNQTPGHRQKNFAVINVEEHGGRIIRKNII